MMWYLPFLVVTFFAAIIVLFTHIDGYLDDDDWQEAFLYYTLSLVAAYCIFTFFVIIL